MFGRVIINQSELKFKEYDVYRSYYCGLCRALKAEGFFTNLSLNYDMTFLSMLLSALYEPKKLVCDKRCVCHVCKKHSETTDKYSPYVARMTILMAYYKCLDDWQDDKNLPGLLYSVYLKRKVKAITRLYGEKCKKIEDYLKEFYAMEKSASIDECSSLFGKITAEVFTPEEDLWKDALYNIGFNLGKFIYIADALEDYDDDVRKNRPNPLKGCTHVSDIKYECMTILNMLAAEATAEFEKLPVIENAEILRNILYSGIWQKIEGDKK